MIFDKSITIQAPVSIVWDALTNQTSMQQWMFETPIDIVTDWKPGSPILIQGDLHSTRFENKGIVLQFKEREILQYSHLNSLSKLPDELVNYTILTFKLTPVEHQTILELTISNFPTEVIYRHLAFYWNVTLEVFKKFTAFTSQ